MKLSRRKIELVLVDIAIIVCVYYMTYLVKLLKLRSIVLNGEIDLTRLLALVGAIMAGRIAFGVYRNIWRYANIQTYMTIMVSDFVSNFVLMLIGRFCFAVNLGIGVHMIVAMAILLVTLLSRYCYQLLYAHRNKNTDNTLEGNSLNQLYQVALSDADDETILRAFLRAKLPDRLVEDFFAFFDVVKSPIAIRSSSLLEDSHYQPFAGIYSTYMIPYLTDKYEMLRMLSDAIKGVYASVYYKDSKAYMQATSNVIDQEKMAVILQEVVGTQYGDRFYPSISGVARSINYYPINDELAEEGTVSLALGLGKYIVDGGLTLRVCPYHPDKVLQTSEMEMALRETQTRFYALDLKNMGQNFSLDDGFNLLKLPVKEAENDGSLNYIASTYDPYDMVIRDGIYPGGRKVITFANILQHDVFPLARILQLVQKYGQGEMRRPVEIEFAVNLNAAEKKGVFYLLQIRPMVDMKADLNEDLDAIPEDQLLLKSVNSLGQGIMDDIQDVIYVKTEGYSASNNQLIAYDIEKLNKRFLDEGKHYILIGPGRWGSSDTWLGIPVKWPNISAARVIVEAGLTNYRVDPSQGTHFFQNLTSFGVGYFTINAYMNDGLYNQELLNSMPAVEETKYLRWVHFDKPLAVKMNGKKKIGVVSFD